MGARVGWPVTGTHSRTVPSPSPAASSLPPGLNATAATPPLIWNGAPMGRPVAGFHSRTAPAPKGGGGRAGGGARGGGGGAVSHRRPVLPPPPRAGGGRWGLTAPPSTPYRALACRGAPTGRRVAVFHSRTVPSAPPVASSVP